MKRLLLILVLAFAWQLNYAQKAIIIPDGQEEKFRKVLINPWEGIDAVQLKDSTWFIWEKDYLKLPADLTVTRKEIVNQKEVDVDYNVKTELSKLPVKVLKKTDFKEAETTISEQPLIK